MDQYLVIEKSDRLSGTLKLSGAKNAVLVIIASLIATNGQSKLTNVPLSDDVLQMIKLLSHLGAKIVSDWQKNELLIDTTNINNWQVPSNIMAKMRASILVLGPLLSKFKRANVALPGGCVLGARPIDLHLKSLVKMGCLIETSGEFVYATCARLTGKKIVLDYPSVGATENLIMAAVTGDGKTTIVNASVEPEVLDLISVLNKMGAEVRVLATSSIEIQGVKELRPVEHRIMNDRLEAGSLLVAAAATGGSLNLPNAPAMYMDTFLEKLSEMGHAVSTDKSGNGIFFSATTHPRAVSFKTMPYPGFPTDLQAPMLVLQCTAQGTSVVHETVHESRLNHTNELIKMGAKIKTQRQVAIIEGVKTLHGTEITAMDIRACAALMAAGLCAQGRTILNGIQHMTRGYQNFDQKLRSIGAKIKTISNFKKVDPGLADFNLTKSELS